MTDANDLILGIETSCDDTAVALVDAEGRVVASGVASQAAIHTLYGGVYPEFASRAHVDKIIPTVRMVLEQANVDPTQLRAIGVTRGPGLVGSLMVGVNAARGLGQGWGVPVVGVNHLRGHLRSADLEERRVRFPALVMLVSGGHTILAHMSAPDEVSLIGTTRDDSVGEAYDKVSRLLGHGYPGGPIVDRLALQGEPKYDFPRPMIKDGLDFSFSGLKTAVDRFIAANPDARDVDVAASFVAACMDVLVAKCRKALSMSPYECLVIVGGVAASAQLRASALELCDELGVSLCLPPLKWSTDNGAMIALAAWDYIAAGQPHGVLEPIPSLSIESY